MPLEAYHSCVLALTVALADVKTHGDFPYSKNSGVEVDRRPSLPALEIPNDGSPMVAREVLVEVMA